MFGLHRFKLHRYLEDGTVKSLWIRQVFGLLRAGLTVYTLYFNLFSEANIYKVIVDLFLAGGETTGTSLDWALLYMIRYPDIQAKCQAEIDKV